MGLFRRKDATGKWWIDHSLSLVLIGILLVQTLFLMYTGPQMYTAEDIPIDYWKWFTHEYILSVVADTYGVVLIVLLSKFLYERGSNESSEDAELKEKENGKPDSKN